METTEPAEPMDTELLLADEEERTNESERAKDTRGHLRGVKLLNQWRW